MKAYDAWKTREPEIPYEDATVEDLPDPIRERYEERVREAAGEAFDRMDALASDFLSQQPVDVRNALARLAIRCYRNNDDVEADVERLTGSLRESFIQRFGAAKYADEAWELALIELEEHERSEHEENMCRRFDDAANEAWL